MHSLRGLDADIPLRSLVAITGVSGSGKSTLVHRVIADNFFRSRGQAAEHPAPITSLEGLESILELLVVDQSPVARSIRSNPVTYVKAWDAIRKVMAGTPEARALGLNESSFSFNAGTGRCEVCEGSGVITYDMHFLAEVTLPCEACEGRRFTRRVLQVQYQGRNVDDILRMTVDDAVEFFSSTPAVQRRLKPLQDVGLGYITLGQSTSTMSGGEAQRLKLAGFLAVNPGAGPSTVMIFDEPTTGLSLSDVEVLIGVFRRLVSEGFSIIVVEHNLEVIRKADWIVDMGPEAGAKGGRIVTAGPPKHVATVGAAAGSHTGAFLAEVL
jgi:excinuclease ABC subunit A